MTINKYNANFFYKKLYSCLNWGKHLSDIKQLTLIFKVIHNEQIRLIYYNI